MVDIDNGELYLVDVECCSVIFGVRFFVRVFYL